MIYSEKLTLRENMLTFFKTQANMHDQELFVYLQGFETLRGELSCNNHLNMNLTPHDGFYDKVLQLPKHVDQSFKHFNTNNKCVDGKCCICKNEQGYKSDIFVHFCDEHKTITLPLVEESPITSENDMKDVYNYINMLRYMHIYLNK